VTIVPPTAVAVEGAHPLRGAARTRPGGVPISSDQGDATPLSRA